MEIMVLKENGQFGYSDKDCKVSEMSTLGMQPAYVPTAIIVDEKTYRFVHGIPEFMIYMTDDGQFLKIFNDWREN